MNGRAVKSALWGAAAGAIALAVVGSWWPGWMFTANAEKMAAERASSAVVAALAPICVARVQALPDAAAIIAKMKDVPHWDRGDAVAKTGAATLPGMKEPHSEVAKACAELLVK